MDRTELAKILFSGTMLAIGLVADHVLHADEIFLVAVFGLGYIVCGYDIYNECYHNLKHKVVFDENLLMAVASLGAFLIGEYPEALAVVTFFSVGELFEHMAVDRSRRSISSLVDMMPETANVIRDGIMVTVDPGDVGVGETIVIKPGEKVPLDSVIVSGSASVDTKALTGESIPRNVIAGDEVLSGMVVLDSSLTARTLRVSDDSAVSRIVELIEESASRKAHAERFLTVFSRYYTPSVCLASLLIFLSSMLLGCDTYGSLYRALTVLVVSCPCALVISIPMGFFSGIGCSSRLGVLVKGGNYLEAMNRLDTVVFDKTGTLTEGRFSVIGAYPTVDDIDILAVVARAESLSDHPIAKSIVQSYGRVPAPPDSSENIAGAGILSVFDGKRVLVGNRRLMSMYGIDIPDTEIAGTAVHAAMDDDYIGYILIGDTVRDGALETVSELKASGIRTVMLTGDSDAVAKDVAKELGVDSYRSELMPEEKLTILEDIIDKAEGTVAFVGDGINDAPSLARADIGIAMGGIGSDVAIEASDIILMNDSPVGVVSARRISRKTMRIVYQNVVFALGVKIGIIVLAAIGHANMYLAIFGDVGVSVIAILNAARCLSTRGMRVGKND